MLSLTNTQFASEWNVFRKNIWLLQNLQKLEEDRKLFFDYAQNMRQSGNERRL